MAVGRLGFGSGEGIELATLEEMLDILSQLTMLGDNRPMEPTAGDVDPKDPMGIGGPPRMGGCDEGRGGGREQGSEGGPEGGIRGELGSGDMGGITIEVGRHLTVTRPVGSDRNHSERCRILSVCLWWTCKDK